MDGKRIGKLRFPAGELDLTEAVQPGRKHVLSIFVEALPLTETVLAFNDNWQDAARIANTMERPVLSDTGYLECVGLCKCEDPEYCDYYDATHELVGPCNKCGRQILERGCTNACEGLHDEHDGGWVSTEHGHQTWCSQECRDADRANDIEVEVLDRMAGI